MKIRTIALLGALAIIARADVAHARDCSCLPAGSLVRVIELGSREQKDVPIENVNPAMHRAARSLEDTEGVEIVGSVSGQADQLVEVHLADGRVVSPTPNHPLYLYEGDVPARADKLSVSDQLVGIDGEPLVIASIARVLGLTKTYNLRTADHTFYANGVKVADYGVQVSGIPQE